ncbi:hypothetical protein CDL15_Pgr028594 [Punica granatum]|uniref:Phosphoglycerate mutase-like protein 1 n=1 Tax=Punica granatum TaxID=22663 RepID=A0A218VWC7_PUNGR|nr:hypothetical protein CDL15_Pgr028594 [Punica granatum]
MDSLSLAPKQSQQYQHVLVMRHGDRIDELVDSWLSNATRPWDPPLVDAGCVRAFHTGAKLRTQLRFPIHRVFVSPFMRCIETASEVVSALCAIRGDSDALPRTDMPIDTSKIKVSIEYGISEMFNSMGIQTPPKDGEWGFNLPELELKLPAGTLDPEFEPVVKEVENGTLVAYFPTFTT